MTPHRVSDGRSLWPFPTRSLFIQIFLWFWLAMTLVGIVLLALEASRTRELTRRWWGLTGDAFATYAISSAEALEEDNRSPTAGGQKLGKYLRDLEMRANVHARLLDEQNREITPRGNAIPLTQPSWIVERMQALAERARRTNQTEFEPLGRITLVASLAMSPRGHRYILLGELPTAHYGPWIPNSRVQALRLLAILVSAGLVCWGLGRHLTAPIEVLRAATAKLAQGDLSARASPGLSERRDELADLAQDFDQMAMHMQQLVQDQQRMVAEQHQLLQAQRSLLADVAHELRSPLARASVALEMARDRAIEVQPINRDAPGKRSTLNDAHNRIERETQHLSILIDRILTLARLESGAQEAESTIIFLPDLVRSVVADADYEASPQQRVVSILECDDCTICGTPALLHSAVENVVRNALHYTAEGTTVEVSLHEREARVLKGGDQSTFNVEIEAFSHAVITVRDHGPGVPAAELQDVFRPFYRARGARSRESGGGGLGLAIASRAVELHGGQIQASNAPDGGLIVELFLPLKDNDSNHHIEQDP